jgi:hypothetical protein
MHVFAAAMACCEPAVFQCLQLAACGCSSGWHACNELVFAAQYRHPALCTFFLSAALDALPWMHRSGELNDIEAICGMGGSSGLRFREGVQ